MFLTIRPNLAEVEYTTLMVEQACSNFWNTPVVRNEAKCVRRRRKKRRRKRKKR
jgi:hypothetical protein